jgi:prepilin-type N-terminal cleavage/methylation domain-containing protein
MNIYKQKGFTLIELLVVISIIGLLSSVLLVSLNAARSKARDSYRRSTFVQLRNAIELYYTKHGSYPSTNGNFFQSDPDDCDGVSNHYCNWSNTNNGNWIPGLVADGDIKALPHDPRPNIIMGDCDPDYYGNEAATYIYFSHDGSGYTLGSVCGMENKISTNDTFYNTYIPTFVTPDPNSLKVCVAGKTWNSGANDNCINGGF